VKAEIKQQQQEEEEEEEEEEGKLTYSKQK
jgi:hypothetical protein